MPPINISEKDYGNIEKFFVTAQSLLIYGRALYARKPVPVASHSAAISPGATAKNSSSSPTNKKSSKEVKEGTPAGSPSGDLSAAIPVIPPSDVMKSIMERRSTPGGAPVLAGLSGTQNSTITNINEVYAGEKRLWSEFASMFWRVAYSQRIGLLFYISSNPETTLSELFLCLLDYVKRRLTTCEKKERMRIVDELGLDKVLYFLRNIASVKKLSLIVNNDTSVVERLRVKFFAEVKAGGHLPWMCLVYVSFCDHASQCCKNKGYVTSLTVFSVSEILRCLFYCCEGDLECATEMFYSEPVPCITYMFYGLKLRIQTQALIRPFEVDEAAIKDSQLLETLDADGRTNSTYNPQAFLGESNNNNVGTSSGTALADDDSSDRQALSAAINVMHRVRSKMSSWKSHYFSGLEQYRGADNHIKLAEKVLQSDTCNKINSINDPNLTSIQLYHLIQLGRCNAFDEIMHLALDIVIASINKTQLYDDCTVYSSLDSFLALSVKGLEERKSSSGNGNLLALLPLYENVVVTLHTVLAILETLQYHSPPKEEENEHSLEQKEKILKQLFDSREVFFSLIAASELPKKIKEVIQAVPHILAADTALWRHCREFITLNKSNEVALFTNNSIVNNQSLSISDAASVATHQTGVNTLSFAGMMSPRSPGILKKSGSANNLQAHGVSFAMEPSNRPARREVSVPKDTSAGGTNFAKSIFKSMFGGKSGSKKAAGRANVSVPPLLNNIHQDNDEISIGSGSGLGSTGTSFGGKSGNGKDATQEADWFRLSSFCNFGTEMVSILNEIMLDSSVGADVQFCAVLLLANYAICSNNVLDNFGSRATIKGMIKVVLNQLKEQENVMENASGQKLVAVSRTALSKTEFYSFLDKILASWERAYFVLQLSPLTSEAVLLTELPPYFFYSTEPSEHANGIRYLEPFFGRVVSLWLCSVVKSESDEDMDNRSVSILTSLFQRALVMNQIPKESEIIHLQNLHLDNSADGNLANSSGGATLNKFGLPLSRMTDSMDTKSFFQENNIGTFMGNTSLFGDKHLPPLGATKDRFNGEQSTSSIETLAKIFKTIVHRIPSIITAEGLQLLLALFSSTKGSLVNLGKECIISTFSFETVYSVYANIFRNSEGDVTQCTQLLNVFANYIFLTNESLEQVYHERRGWMVEHGLFEAVLDILCFVLKNPYNIGNFLNIVSDLFRFFCAFEPNEEHSPCLKETKFVEKLTEVLEFLNGAEYQVIVLQSIFDASTVNYSVYSAKNAFTMTMVGNFHLSSLNCSADKPIFLDLIPPIAKNIFDSNNHALFDNLLQVLTIVLKNTTLVSSVLLREFVMSRKLTQFLPYLHLTDECLNTLPFVGVPPDLLKFWKPILLNAPRRSEIRFHHTGGVKINVGTWPAKGFTISSYFYFDEIYPTIPLFQFSDVETANKAAPVNGNASPFSLASPNAVNLGGPLASSLSSPLSKTVVLFVSGGDSVQVSYQGHNVALNENTALQNFERKKWLHFSVVISSAQTITVYLNGFFVGSTTMPFINAGSEVCVRVGFVDKTVPDALYSISEIVLWDEELTRSQVEANLAMTPYIPCAFKVLSREIAREASSNATTASPIDDRIARFVPFENDHTLLLNILDGEDRYPIVAKVVGRHSQLPKCWVNFRELFVVQGGMQMMLQWLYEAETASDLEEIMLLVSECVREVTVMATVNPNMYLLLGVIIKHKSAFMTEAACDALINMGAQAMNINDSRHDIILNRLLFKLVLSDSDMYTRMPEKSSRYILNRIARLFTASKCFYAKHNAQYIAGSCFIDRLLHSMIHVSMKTSLQLRRDIIDCAKQMISASDMDETMIHCIISFCSVLTPTEIIVTSRYNPSIVVTLPENSNINVYLPLRIADNIVVNLFRSLLEFSSSTIFLNSLSRLLSISWFTTVVARFANPSSVVYATKLFFDAVAVSQTLRDQVASHHSTIIEALRPHARYEDVVLLLLAFTLGAEKHIDLLSEKFSLMRQLDSVLGTFQPVPNLIIAPIFVKLFAVHLSSIIQYPFFEQLPFHSTLMRQQKLSFRVRRYFSLAKVCARFMLFIKAKRYNNSIKRRLIEVLRSSVELNSDHSGKKAESSLTLSFNNNNSIAVTLNPNNLPATLPHQESNESFGSPKITSNTFILNQSFDVNVPFLSSTAGDSSFLKDKSFSPLTPSSPRGAGPMRPQESDSYPRVRHAKFKRAFAVLRVCVLLNVNFEVRRFHRVFEKTLTTKEKEDRVTQKHRSTLFCLSALRRFSAMSSLFYVFVSSPLEITAFSAFISYISRPKLAVRENDWVTFIKSVNPPPAKKDKDVDYGTKPATTTLAAEKGTPESSVNPNALISPLLSPHSEVASGQLTPAQGLISSFVSETTKEGNTENNNSNNVTNVVDISLTSGHNDIESSSLAEHFASLLPPIDNAEDSKESLAISKFRTVSDQFSQHGEEEGNSDNDFEDPLGMGGVMSDPNHSNSNSNTTTNDKNLTNSIRGLNATTNVNDDSSSDGSSSDSVASPTNDPLAGTTSNLLNPPSLQVMEEPTTLFYADTHKIIETVGEVVRREAIGVLESLIQASLQTPAHQGWVGGPTYGSCGGLMFQMLLIISSQTPNDDAIPTLIKYFLSHVVTNVKNTKDPEMVASTMKDITASNKKNAEAQHLSGTASSDSRSSSADSTYSLRSISSLNENVTPSNGTGCSEIFLFNVGHFCELIVDLLSVNVIDLPTVSTFFLSLLVLSQSWPERYVHQLSCQVMRACICVLNKPSMQDASMELIETVYSLSTLVLRRGFKMKGCIECMFRVLYKIYVSLPPVWMSLSDSLHRKRLIVLMFRHIATVYHKTKYLKKAFTVRTLTQRFSLYDPLTKALTKGTEDEAIAQFAAYCEKNASSMETMLSARMKQKADMAFKTTIKLRGEYIKRIKNFNSQYVSAMEIAQGFHPLELSGEYLHKYTSYVASPPSVQESEFEWLVQNDECLASSFLNYKSQHDDTFHYMDVENNYGVVHKTNLNLTHLEKLKRTFRPTHCEKQIRHVALIVPRLAARCKPFLFDTQSFIHPNIDFLSPSAITLLRFILEPGEQLRFISNGFRVFGIQSTPCLILLTAVTLKIISYSRVTHDGEIILCQTESDEDMLNSSMATSNSDLEGSLSSQKAKKTRYNPFSISAMTKQLQRLLTDKEQKRQQQRDGTKVAQSVRQATGSNYCHVYWTYTTRSITEVRSVHYMHQDTAVVISMLHDSGPLLSIVDSSNSMNSSARANFLAELKEVVNPRHCTFIDDSQRGALLKSKLLRWATGSLSNYDYLKFLNAAAGRTSRDFNQYPVFPWVISDYTSPRIDLEKPESFRLFNYPMGAQTEQRRETVEQLYNNTKEICNPDTGESFPFHHGTHYSTSGGILYFMIRVEPFTSFAKMFQGGEFDIATRLFDSVGASYNSCILGPADCKELVPEFYRNAKFLINADRLELGTKADGNVVDHVQLPPWAKGSTQVFTAVMRYALECEFTLNHIHSWIDLIFGVRRRGKLALERYNVFQRMTYSEEVRSALKEAQTRHETDVIVAEVDNFGQTPVQLFTERHPAHHELEPARKGNTGSHTLEKGTLASISANYGSGNTYTLSYAKEAPKVMRMLIHTSDVPQTHFQLHELNSAQLHTIPANLQSIFGSSERGVLGFAFLPSGKVTPSLLHLIAVEDEDHYLCWHEHESRLMRFNAVDGQFCSTIAFDVYNVSRQHICAVASSPSESAIFIGVKSGIMYFLYSDSIDRMVYLKSTFCYHTHPVTKFVVDPTSGRMLSFTDNANDVPRVWVAQRSLCNFLHSLDIATVRCPNDDNIREADRVVVDACMDTLNLHSIVITNRMLIVFDDNGELFGAGALPSPKKRDGAPMLEDDDGEVGLAVDDVGVLMANLTAVALYTTQEWSSGMQLYLTGHMDGSLSLWRSTRLPPDTVAPGKIAMIEFHGVVNDGKLNSSFGSVTSIKQPKIDIPLFYIGYSSGVVRVLEFAIPLTPEEQKARDKKK